MEFLKNTQYKRGKKTGGLCIQAKFFFNKEKKEAVKIKDAF
jgi:hypothetical protein